MNLNLKLSSYTKFISKKDHGLAYEAENYKTSKKKKRKSLVSSLRQSVLDLTPKTWSIEGKIDRMDFIKIIIIIFCCERLLIDEKTNYRLGKSGETLANHTYKKGFVLRIYKELS